MELQEEEKRRVGFKDLRFSIGLKIYLVFYHLNKSVKKGCFFSIFFTFTLMKKITILFALLVSGFASQAQITEAFGPFYNVNVFVNKGNLFNSDDLRVDSFQKYAITPAFAGSLEYGRLYDNGFSYSIGLQFGTCGQKYTGVDSAYPYTLNATTKSSFLKVPLTFSHQTRNDKKLKFMYSLGFFYGLTLAYTDKISMDYTDANLPDYETTITKDKIVTTSAKDTTKRSYALDASPVNKHGLGALGGVGVSYRIKPRTEFIAQVKGEFQFTDLENDTEILHTPTDGTAGVTQLNYVYGNYAKYMNANSSNFRRAATHPFNLGLTIGLRFYVFTFQ